MTECNEQSWLFQELGFRKVEADFGGGYLSSDGGGLILREFEHHSGLLRDLAGCFVDYRNPLYIEHSVQELLSQRIYGLILGYEDLNDHDHLRRDPVHGLICGKRDPLGQDRVLERPSTRSFIARGVTWKTVSRSNNWICLPIGPVHTGWRPISYGFGFSFCPLDHEHAAGRSFKRHRIGKRLHWPGACVAR